MWRNGRKHQISFELYLSFYDNISVPFCDIVVSSLILIFIIRSEIHHSISHLFVQIQIIQILQTGYILVWIQKLICGFYVNIKNCTLSFTDQGCIYIIINLCIWFTTMAQFIQILYDLTCILCVFFAFLFLTFKSTQLRLHLQINQEEFVQFLIKETCYGNLFLDLQ